MNTEQKRFPKIQRERREPKAKAPSRTERHKIKTALRKSQRSGRGRGGTHGTNN